ncbi:MAG: tRNA (adenosine(37)-N6)-threonylcarbamoyltransferase complex transferase subunit TsaD [Gammaproteobacteria bacterium]
MKILGIETSCDETGIAIYDSEQGLIGHQLHSQINLHQLYGGVVPELASRDHIRQLAPLLKGLLKTTGLLMSDINALAVTAGPGLIGALLVGVGFARGLATALQVPCIPVHHMEAHLLAALMTSERVQFPFLSLLVSGGHTLLVHARALGDYVILGQSIDDAAGEAFDKTAKLLDLGYPGGPAIAQCAQNGQAQHFEFPRPMMNKPGMDFSFSGLKTFVLNTWMHSDQSAQTKADIAHAFQEAVVDTLVRKCQRALDATGLTQLVVAGGVGANQLLRERLTHLGQQHGITVEYPPLAFCTDNGAMVAYTGWCYWREGRRIPTHIKARARWPLDAL